MQPSSFARFTTTTLWIVLAGCGDSGLVPGRIPLVTDRAAYVAESVSTIGQQPQYGFTVIARFENRTGSPTYLESCSYASPSYGVQLSGMTGQVAYEPFYACGASAGILVPPGAIRIDTLRLRGPNGLDDAGAPMGLLEGEFQLVYGVRPCASDIDCRSVEAPSNTFRVQLSR